MYPGKVGGEVVAMDIFILTRRLDISTSGVSVGFFFLRNNKKKKPGTNTTLISLGDLKMNFFLCPININP